MKRILFLLTLSLAVISCKNSEEKPVEAEVTTEETGTKGTIFKGEFIYVESDNAAVLKGSSYIYGVNLNGKAMELVAEVNKVKKDPFDMVPVEVRGTITRNNGLKEGEEGWETIVTISEIIHVSNAPSEADIKIEDKQN